MSRDDYLFRRLQREVKNWSEILDPQDEDPVEHNPTRAIIALVFLTVLMIGVGVASLFGESI